MHIEAPQLVFAAEYFPVLDRQSPILKAIMTDPDIGPHVSGLWLPRHMLHDLDRSSPFENIARGQNLEPYNPLTGNPPVENPPFLIIDTSASGGDPDIASDLERTFRAHSAKTTIFTVEPTVDADTIKTIKKAFEAGKDIRFLISGVYPERSPEAVLASYLQSEDAVTANHSKLVDDFDILGVAAVGELAKHTRIGQFFLAMGVTHDGINYKGRDGKLKRACTPEVALQSASNTHLLIGRALARGISETEMNNYDDSVLDRIKRNLKEIIDRMLTVNEHNNFREM